jgi:hypothetical protein
LRKSAADRAFLGEQEDKTDWDFLTQAHSHCSKFQFELKKSLEITSLFKFQDSYFETCRQDVTMDVMLVLCIIWKVEMLKSQGIF